MHPSPLLLRVAARNLCGRAPSLAFPHHSPSPSTGFGVQGSLGFLQLELRFSQLLAERGGLALSRCQLSLQPRSSLEGMEAINS